MWLHVSSKCLHIYISSFYLLISQTKRAIGQYLLNKCVGELSSKVSYSHELGYDVLDGYFVGRGLKFKTELWPLILN